MFRQADHAALPFLVPVALDALLVVLEIGLPPEQRRAKFVAFGFELRQLLLEVGKNRYTIAAVFSIRRGGCPGCRAAGVVRRIVESFWIFVIALHELLLLMESLKSRAT